MRVIEYFSGKSRSYLTAIGLALLLITGYIDYRTGTEMSLSVFYLIPIGFVGWFIGRTAGILMSVLSTLTISLEYYLSEQAGMASTNFFVEAWNLSLVLGFFIVVTLLMSKLKLNISQRERVIEIRTAELANTNQSLQLQMAARIQAEDELRKTYDELEKKVCERTEELSATNTLLMQEIDRHWESKEQILIYQKELQDLIHRMSIMEEQDRRQLSEELHDTIGHNLALAKFRLAALRQSASSKNTVRETSEILDLIEQSIKYTRSLTFELSSPIFYKLGLQSAIEWLCGHFQDKYGITVDFVPDERLSCLDGETGILLFKSIRELLVNIIKHARTRNAGITVSGDDRTIIVEVHDDGIGCDVSFLSLDKCKTGGFGLFNIRERINYIGGSFEMHSTRDSGTTVILIVPMKGELSS